MKNRPINGKNKQFFDTLELNNQTFYDYLNRFEKIALSIFEWVNLPKTMDARFLEKSLYLYGMAAIFKDPEYGFINTNCNNSGQLNIYGLPTTINCYSFDFQRKKRLYTGLISENKELKELQDNQAILVMNDWNCTPTHSSLLLFAYRLYECERSCDINIKNTKFPLFIKTTEKQKHTMINIYNQLNGNSPVIITDKNNVNIDDLEVFKTDIPFLANDIMQYKKQIWNEALTFLRYK